MAIDNSLLNSYQWLSVLFGKSNLNVKKGVILSIEVTDENYKKHLDKIERIMSHAEPRREYPFDASMVLVSRYEESKGYSVDSALNKIYNAFYINTYLTSQGQL